MDIFNIQALIKEGRLITANDVDPTESYLQVGVFQKGNRASGASNADAYPSYALPLSELLTTQPNDISFAVSDEVTPLTVGTDKITIHAPYNFTLLSVFAGLTTMQTSGNLVTVDINKNGASIFSTLLTISNNQDTSLTAAVQPVFSTISFIKGDKITVDISDLGDGTATGLKIYLYVQPV